MKSARFHEIHQISPEIRMKSAGFHEIRNVSFCIMIKYRSFEKRKTNQGGCALSLLFLGLQ